MARAAFARRNAPPVKLRETRLGATSVQGATYPGGLDLTTPTLSLQAGALRGGLNAELPLTGGYGRIAGYERFDGRASPSDAVFVVAQVTSFTNVPSVGDVITQSGSGATGTVAALSNPVGGPYYMVVTKTSGTFASTGTITKAGPTTIGSTTATTVELTAQENAQYLNAAADIYRADIGAVPGSGDILGVVAATFSGVDRVYAFRNNAGGTAADLYVSSASGWTQITMPYVAEFTAGAVTTPADGETLTQGGVTATVRRVMTRSGTWTGTAAGGFVIGAPSGGNFAAGAATLSGGATVTLAGAQTQVVLLPDGRYQFHKGNFSGGAASQRVYGCDGVNKAFEFDGTTLAPITSGLTDDRPSNIDIHNNHLFLSYGASLIHSGPGTPFKFLAVNGGGEIATGDVVTAMQTLPGAQQTATLAVFQRGGTRILYGASSADWLLVEVNTSSGASPYSAQNLFDCFVFDNLGVVTMQATLNFGNFASSTLTKNILPFILQERSRLSASSINRTKGQYRVFFSDGYGLYLTSANQQYLGCCPVFFPNPVNVIDQHVTSDGEEVSYFGSNDDGGYVYQIDKGTSFDGEAINWYITLAWDAQRSPRILKRYRAVSIEIQSDNWVQVEFGYQLGYGSTRIIQPDLTTHETDFVAAPVWDVFTWDEFTWDGQTLAPTDIAMVGTAENVQVTLGCTSDYIQPFVVNSCIYQYTMRRGMRV